LATCTHDDDAGIRIPRRVIPLIVRRGERAWAASPAPHHVQYGPTGPRVVGGRGSRQQAAAAAAALVGGFRVTHRSVRLIRSSPPRRPSIVLLACCLVRLRVRTWRYHRSSRYQLVGLAASPTPVARRPHTTARHDIAERPTRRHTVV